MGKFSKSGLEYLTENHKINDKILQLHDLKSLNLDKLTAKLSDVSGVK